MESNKGFLEAMASRVCPQDLGLWDPFHSWPI